MYVGSSTTGLYRRKGNRGIFIANPYKEKGASPFSITLKPGSHTIRAEKEGYKVWRKTVNLKSGKMISLFPVLEFIMPIFIKASLSKPVRQFISSGSQGEIVPAQSILVSTLDAALKGKVDLDNDKYVTGTELGSFIAQQVSLYSSGSLHPQYGKIHNPDFNQGDFVFSIDSNSRKKCYISKQFRAYYWGE